MDRRAFLGSLGLLAAPLAARAQQAGRVYRIGYLSPEAGGDPRAEAYRQAFRQLGYVEGQNLVVEWRFTEGRPVSAELAAELIRPNLDCILVTGVAPSLS